MAISVQMPALGESVTEGTVTRWLKQVGDRVEVDEPLLEVSTDKVDTEIPSPAAGVLEKIVAQEDETVEIGAELAVIGDGSGAGGNGSDSGSDSASANGSDSGSDNGQAAQATAPTAQPAEQAAPEPEPAAAPQAQAAPAQSGGDVEGTPVTMPELGESVTEGTVTRWLK